MERQIIINHTHSDVDNKINDILRYFDAIMSLDSTASCTFNLYPEQYDILKVIKVFQNSKVKKAKSDANNITGNEFFAVEIHFSGSQLHNLLQVVMKNELNALVCYDTIRLCLNDNDGDFFVVNNDPNYKLIMSLQ